MVRLENVNKYYQSGSEKIHAIKNLNITFPDKGLVFILGPSGCGKSTLLNMLGGLDKPDDGAIYIEDRDIKTFSNGDLNNYLNSYLGFVFQEYNILKDLNLYDNIALPLEMQNVNKKEIKRKTLEIIDQVGLSSLRKRKINQLSGGQRQRISIARAILKNPPILILDEATSALDTESEKLVQEALENLMKNRTTIVIAHRLSTVRNADEICVLEKGKIIERGNHDELMAQKGAYFNLQQSQSLK